MRKGKKEQKTFAHLFSKPCKITGAGVAMGVGAAVLVFASLPTRFCFFHPLFTGLFFFARLLSRSLALTLSLSLSLALTLSLSLSLSLFRHFLPSSSRLSLLIFCVWRFFFFFFFFFVCAGCGVPPCRSTAADRRRSGSRANAESRASTLTRTLTREPSREDRIFFFFFLVSC
jgi:hypothetical protein